MSPRIMPENRIPDIVNAAIAVFSRKGYRMTQMEEIAKEAAVSKATVYYYFKSKIHLFQYVLENGHEKKLGAPPSESDLPKDEHDFLRELKKRLKKSTNLRSIGKLLGRRAGEVDLEKEMSEILEELWDINENNRGRIIILEKSFFEFPELAEIYHKYARSRLLRQLEEYLALRMEQGIVRPLNSVKMPARFILESLAWFGFKQSGPPDRMFTKQQVLPDLTSILVGGLRL